MLILAVVLGVVGVVGIVLALVNRSRLAAQRRLTAAAEATSAERTAELASTAAALDAAARERAAADERATAEAARADEAESRAAAAEQRAAEFAVARAAAAADGGGIDARLLWTLEQARSERTWRHSVAPGPDSVSVFSDASDPLFEALQVELDAAREEVGAVVELEADLPPGVTAAGSVLALRAAQELLANVVRRGEVTTLHVHAEGVDLVVAVRSVDEAGEPVSTEPLAIPSTADIELIADGVRILGAVGPPAGSADDGQTETATSAGEPPAEETADEDSSDDDTADVGPT